MASQGMLRLAVAANDHSNANTWKLAYQEPGNQYSMKQMIYSLFTIRAIQFRIVVANCKVYCLYKSLQNMTSEIKMNFNVTNV